MWRAGESGEPYAHFRQAIGKASNNVAEYEGLKTGMQRAKRVGDKSVVFEVDSKLVAKHMAHKDAWTCKTEDLKPLYRACRKLGEELKERGIEWEVRHIYREYNQSADSLANEALDDEEGNGPSEHW